MKARITSNILIIVLPNVSKIWKMKNKQGWKIEKLIKLVVDLYLDSSSACCGRGLRARGAGACCGLRARAAGEYKPALTSVFYNFSVSGEFPTFSLGYDPG